MSFEQIVETPQTAEPGCHGDIKYRQICIRQQVFGKKQTARLEVLYGRYMVLRRENTP